MKTFGFAIIGLVALQACSSSAPASITNTSFTTAVDSVVGWARRDVELISTEPTTFIAPEPVQTSAIGASELTIAGIGQTQYLGETPSVTDNFSTSHDAVSAANNTSISDEQDYNAVVSRESIVSDAQRRAEQAAMREQVQPTALPSRPAITGPNIVEYALNAPNNKGQEWYSRSIFATQARFQRNCVKYTSPDAAQRDFLANGGPNRDRRGLDPDGDGFACGWDPAPFLSVTNR